MNFCERLSLIGLLIIGGVFAAIVAAVVIAIMLALSPIAVAGFGIYYAWLLWAERDMPMFYH